MPIISIVVPAYNAQTYLRCTIDSIIAQTFADWELLVVDDGSADKTPEVVEAYVQEDDRIRLVRQANAGVSAARMTGFRSSDPTSSYVIFLDADDLWEPGALAKLKAALDAAPAALGAHGLARLIDESGSEFDAGWGVEYSRDRRGVIGKTLVPWRPDQPTTFEVLIFQNCIFTSGQVLMRREAIEMSGGYDPALHASEDWDLWVRLAARGYFAFVDEVVLSYRRHAAAVSADSEAMVRAGATTRRKFLTSTWLTEEQRRIARSATYWNQRTYCQLRWQWAWDSLTRGQVGQAAIQARRALMDTVRVSMMRA